MGIYPTKGQHDHNQGLRGPDIAEGIAQIIAGGNRSRVIESNHHRTHHNAKENVGTESGQVGPAVDKLAAVGRASHFKIETQHVITPDRARFFQHKEPATRRRGGFWLRRELFADMRLCGIARNYPVSASRAAHFQREHERSG
jgi:hypothetical protein